MSIATRCRSITQMLIVLLAGLLLLSACFPAAPTTTLPSATATSVPMATLEPTTTKAPAATAVPAPDGSPHLSLDTGSMATGFQTETVAAVPANDDAPYWEVLPEYTRVTLQGYPISNHLIKPQIFEIIEEHIVNNVRERGEIQLTSALDRLRREDGFLGLVMEGRRYDIGLPQHYLETLATFSE